MNEHLRQTGRTDRMLGMAASLVAQGYTVHVLMANEMEARNLRDSRRHAYPLNQLTVGTVDGLDWKTLRPRDVPYHPDTKYLIDHHAVELRLQDLDEEILQKQQLARQLYALTT